VRRSLGSEEWQSRTIFLGRNKEVFDAEIYAIWVGLVAARDHGEGLEALRAKLGGPKAITISADSQAALKR
jgi:hypothetical protein